MFPEIRGVTYTARLDLLASDTSAMAAAFLVTFDARTTRASRNQILPRAQALVRSRLSASATVLER